MTHPTAPVGELTEILSGFAFKSEQFNNSGEGLPLIRIRDVVEGVSDTYYSGDYKSEFLVKNGDALIGMDGQFNLACWRGGPALLNQRVCKIKATDERLYQGYLLRFLPAVLKEIEDRTPFVTVKHLSVKSLREIEIPLPPLPEQRRIAAILDKADVLRAKRREAIAKLDKLLQSVFLDMFGDPVTNPKGWPTRGIAELAQQLRDGPFGSNLKSEHYQPSGIRVIRLQNIGVWRFLGNDAAYVSEEHFARLPRNHCRPGDVLIGTLGDPNLRACILPESIERALNKADCLLFRPEPGLATAEYICGLMNCESLIQSASGLALGQTRLRISMGRLKELSVPLPPLEVQQRFTSFCRQYESERDTALKSMATIEALFSSLQKQFFETHQSKSLTSE